MFTRRQLKNLFSFVRQIKKHKVYLVLRYYAESCEVLDVYNNKKSAETRVAREEKRSEELGHVGFSHHIITKKIKDSKYQ